MMAINSCHAGASIRSESARFGVSAASDPWSPVLATLPVQGSLASYFADGASPSWGQVAAISAAEAARLKRRRPRARR